MKGLATSSQATLTCAGQQETEAAADVRQCSLMRLGLCVDPLHVLC